MLRADRDRRAAAADGGGFEPATRRKLRRVVEGQLIGCPATEVSGLIGVADCVGSAMQGVWKIETRGVH